MEQISLSLKNLYKVLTSKDYPSPSNGVFKAQELKGLTLLRFWESILCNDFKNGRFGRTIWRTEGGRNRYLSDICNKSDRLTIYTQYTDELLRTISSENLLNQIFLFMNFLWDHNYNYKTFENKMNIFLNVLLVGDPLFDKELFSYFDRCVHSINPKTQTPSVNSIDEKYNNSFIELKLFVHSWFLTMLTIHALVGPEIVSDRLEHFRAQKDFDVIKLWNDYKIRANAINVSSERSIKILSSNSESYENKLLSSPSISRRLFVGRDKDIYMLCNALSQNEHMLFYGTAGTGKNEILKQFIRIIQEDRLANEIVIAQYRDSLSQTLVDSLGATLGTVVPFSMKNHMTAVSSNTEHSIFESASQLDIIMTNLKEHCNSKLVIIINEVDSSIVNDPVWPEFCALDCCIILSSSQGSISGFNHYMISPLSRESAILLFLHNYRYSYSPTLLSTLEELFADESYRQPKYIMFLAKQASDTNMPPSQLLELLKNM